MIIILIISAWLLLGFLGMCFFIRDWLRTFNKVEAKDVWNFISSIICGPFTFFAGLFTEVDYQLRKFVSSNTKFNQKIAELINKIAGRK